MNGTLPLHSFQVGTLKVLVFEDSVAMGAAAAAAAAEVLQSHAHDYKHFAVIFATGHSQMKTLSSLTAIPGLPWDQLDAFHMDEYLGIPETHPASFRAFLHTHLTEKVHLHKAYMIDGSDSNAGQTCAAYAQLLESHKPFLCFLGIGENGHIAFNDPDVADFEDPDLVKVVTLDDVCRLQQVAEGWFPTVADVPKQAITLTVPALFRVPKLIVSVPGSRKAKIVRRTLEDVISTACPATILRTHPDATVYLDRDSAALLPAAYFGGKRADIHVGSR